MEQKIDELISVLFTFNNNTKINKPIKLAWRNRLYSVTSIGLHYTYKTGSTLFHVYSLSSNNISFKTIFNTTNLQWTLESIYSP